MNTRWLFAVAALIASGILSSAADPQAPKAGKVEILPLKDIKPGMHGIAWTVFSGTEPEPVPIEIIGIMEGRTGRAGRDSRQDGRARPRRPTSRPA